MAFCHRDFIGHFWRRVVIIDVFVSRRENHCDILEVTLKLREISEIIESKASELRMIAESLDEQLSAVKESWPDHQIVSVDGCWHGRDETPPPGVIWASDGKRVWLINSDGSPIPETATAVLYWTTACIPAPPDLGNSK